MFFWFQVRKRLTFEIIWKSVHARHLDKAAIGEFFPTARQADPQIYLARPQCRFQLRCDLAGSVTLPPQIIVVISPRQVSHRQPIPHPLAIIEDDAILPLAFGRKIVNDPGNFLGPNSSQGTRSLAVFDIVTKIRIDRRFKDSAHAGEQGPVQYFLPGLFIHLLDEPH